ncbi:hypothetical protein [Rheinheimera fenheensis]|uniref:hypothetical protein n=1 Tax=Rheinheimera fenheensis TaxID=3152295 RepID=UPI003261818E
MSRILLGFLFVFGSMTSFEHSFLSLLIGIALIFWGGRSMTSGYQQELNERAERELIEREKYRQKIQNIAADELSRENRTKN